VGRKHGDGRAEAAGAAGRRARPGGGGGPRRRVRSGRWRWWRG